ncbi:MAG: hypothetical protein H6Q68_2422 [Firmicutes bacterium]|nr:hypothetical protein [Bacillota bacterium]
MNTIINGIPVTTDPALSQEETIRIVSKLIKDWSWEGKQLGKVELIRDGAWIHICSYEQPCIQIVPYA